MGLSNCNKKSEKKFEKPETKKEFSVTKVGKRK
jgi:hypothetical protein